MNLEDKLIFSNITSQNMIFGPVKLLFGENNSLKLSINIQ